MSSRSDTYNFIKSETGKEPFNILMNCEQFTNKD